MPALSLAVMEPQLTLVINANQPTNQPMPCTYAQTLEKNGVNARPGVRLGNLSVPASDPNQTSSSSSGHTSSGDWRPVVIGVCVGVGGWLAILGLCLFGCWRNRKQKNQQQQPLKEGRVVKEGAKGHVASVPRDTAASSDQHRKGEHSNGKHKRWVFVVLMVGRQGIRTYSCMHPPSGLLCPTLA